MKEKKGNIGKPRMKQLDKLGIKLVDCCPSDEENRSVLMMGISDGSLETITEVGNEEFPGVPESISVKMESPTLTLCGNKNDEQVGFAFNLESGVEFNNDDELNSSIGALNISKETNHEEIVGEEVQKKPELKKSGKKTRKRKKVSSKPNTKVGVRRSARIQK